MKLRLLIDADDTLWENNIYFERAFSRFVDFLNHSTLGPAEVRAVLDEIELVNSRVHGYGSLNFGRNLQQCYQHLAERHIAEEDLRVVMAFAEEILEQPLELIDGVEETLDYLAGRHELTLFTMGNPDEQRLKVDRSGVRRFFRRVEITREKNRDAFEQIVAREGLDRAGTWMIGNSPKTDINPALAAGLNAVLVPHEHTWHLAQEEVRGGQGRFLMVERFRDLQGHF
jgi:putative hydrolase of the HAD superfamily